MSIPKSTASVSVDELVNLQLAERKILEKYRRKINLILTDKRKDIATKSIETPYSYIAMISALEKISKEDVDALLSIHKKLLQLI